MAWPKISLALTAQDFFVGGAHRLHDPRYASKPSSFKGTFLSRFGFRTETSGTLRVRLHLAEQVRARSDGFPAYLTHAQGQSSKSQVQDESHRRWRFSSW